MENTTRLDNTMAVSDAIMVPIHNEPRDISLRKAQNTLITVGTGIILFGVWSVMKTVGLFLLNRKEEVAMLRETSQISEELFSDRTLFVIMLAFYLIILLIDISFRLFVGRSAIAESQGKQCSFLYIPVSVLIILASFVSILFGLYAVFGGFPNNPSGSEISLASIIIELTSMMLVIQMVAAAHQVRKNRKRQASPGE